MAGSPGIGVVTWKALPAVKTPVLLNLPNSGAMWFSDEWQLAQIRTSLAWKSTRAVGRLSCPEMLFHGQGEL